ncbi:MAG: glycosyltransferase [Deltaproteobacteria bacterium]|nr:glycosyltransferase [Deltaproteobacteria bacterium]
MKPLTLIALGSPCDTLKVNFDKLSSLDVFEGSTIADRGQHFDRYLYEIKTDYFAVLDSIGKIEISAQALYELIRNLKKNDAGLAYSDYFLNNSLIKLNDYLPGSFRDDFDFGSIFVFSTEKVKKVLQKYGGLKFRKYGALYDLRLKLSIEYPIIRLERGLYKVHGYTTRSAHERIFSYVDPKNRDYQEEMEEIFISYLKHIDAYIPAQILKNAEDDFSDYPVLASIVIPVKNREKTIADALKSAISQKTNFSYNVLVVDNHSTDKTGKIVEDFSKNYSVIKRLIPESKNLKIGGCWNEAILDPACGRFAVQLDSDDLYENSEVLQLIVDTLIEGKYAMVVGAYRTVDENLNQIPPGIVDHREWTTSNGHNNLLRVGGIGAPRAYRTSLLRKLLFKDIGYAEDYEMALKISREYKIGRIWQPLYMARRWGDNSDSDMDMKKMRVFNEIKDRIRTEEVKERKKFLKSLHDDR